MDDLLITASLFALCAACALSIARRIINRRNVQRETKKNKYSLFSDRVSRSHTTAHLDSQSVKTRLPLLTKRTGQTAEKSAGPRIDTALALEILAAQLDSGLGLHQALTENVNNALRMPHHRSLRERPGGCAVYALPSPWGQTGIPRGHRTLPTRS